MTAQVPPVDIYKRVWIESQDLRDNHHYEKTVHPNEMHVHLVWGLVLVSRLLTWVVQTLPKANEMFSSIDSEMLLRPWYYYCMINHAFPASVHILWSFTYRSPIDLDRPARLVSRRDRPLEQRLLTLLLVLINKEIEFGFRHNRGQLLTSNRIWFVSGSKFTIGKNVIPAKGGGPYIAVIPTVAQSDKYCCAAYCTKLWSRTDIGSGDHLISVLPTQLCRDRLHTCPMCT